MLELKLPGTVSRKFRQYQECELCGATSRWKAKCWAEDDLADVYYACKKCHDGFSCCDCKRPKGAWQGLRS